MRKEDFSLKKRYFLFAKKRKTPNRITAAKAVIFASKESYGRT